MFWHIYSVQVNQQSVNSTELLAAFNLLPVKVAFTLVSIFMAGLDIGISSLVEIGSDVPEFFYYAYMSLLPKGARDILIPQCSFPGCKSYVSQVWVELFQAS